MEKLYLYVDADYNDADMTSRFKEITEKEIELIRPVIEAIKDWENNPKKTVKNYTNYMQGEGLREGMASTEDLYGHLPGYKLFEEKFVPYYEHGICSIDDVRIVKVVEKLL